MIKVKDISEANGEITYSKLKPGDWITDINIPVNVCIVYDKSKLIRKIFTDGEIIEYDGKPIMVILNSKSEVH